MNEDVRESVSELTRRREAEQLARASFLTSWHRLKAYRKGLLKEIGERAPPRLREDAETLYEEMTASGRDALALAARAAETARAAARVHAGSASALGKLAPSWKAVKTRLDAETAEKTRDHEALRDVWDTRRLGARRWAAAKARENRLANERNLLPLQPLVRRLEGLDTALEAIEKGDPKVIECLRRWDIEALVRVASLWKRLPDWRSMTDEDRDYYLSSGIAAVAPTERETAASGTGPAALSDEGDIVRMTLAPGGALTGRIKRDYGGFRSGDGFAGVGTLTMAGLLGSLRMDSLNFDADLVESYMDAVMPSWRETVAESMREEKEKASGTQPAGQPESPYDVLGVSPDMTLAEISKVFIETMQAVQNLANTAPQRRLIAALKEIRRLKAETAPGSGL